MEEFTNEQRAARVRAVFRASEHAAERGNEPLTNLADFVTDLLHLADVTLSFGDAELKRSYERNAGRHLTFGEFTAARALSAYREEVEYHEEMAR